ncbi:MAG: UDP-2,4-diacetamido-2,4,6-trideoxy-beta-L-altropyranose hydrolase [Nitrospirae bacterium]|nr:UDP-2,4-diacetamido-2,4,6-trideoxy-beta-L-altropyranose hydrolase [Candidatus Manganitrophaceae bacterium]
MNVVFRVDASVQIGTGHLMRCLTLAEALRERGAQTQFICREQTGHLIPLLQQKAIPVTVLPAPLKSDIPLGEEYAAWLGVTQAEDAGQTIEVLGGERPDWLVVDHYGLDIEWENRLRPHTGKIMVIDDLANRPHDCDLLLDQNYSAEGEGRYQAMVPETCRRLAGPRYALLRPEYALYRRTRPARDGEVRRVLVFFGGSDPHNMTGLTIEALSQPALRHLAVDVVVGANNPHRPMIEKGAAKRPCTRIYEPRPHLAALMSEADLAIGAGGATTWERMCLGLPAVVISIAENQRPASEALQKVALLDYAGHFPDVTANHIASLLRQRCDNPKGLVERSLRSRLEVDGLGALRVVELLSPSHSSAIRLRPAAEDDVALYYDWRNDRATSNGTEEASSLSWDRHQAWFTDKLHDSNSPLFVAEVSGLPVGQIRFETEKSEALIDYSLDPIVQGRGWEPHLVALGGTHLRQIPPVRLHAAPQKEAPLFLRMSRPGMSIVSDAKATFSIAVLSDRSSWLNGFIQRLSFDWLSIGHRVLWVHHKADLRPADFCFYLSCGQIVPQKILSQYRHNLVVHESDLPKGRGWSPLTWQILDGKNRIPVTLFEAAEKVDSGVIYAQEWIAFEGHELIDELRHAQAEATLTLCKRFVEHYPQILNEAREQAGEADSYPRRRPEDSLIDPEKSISELFPKLRVADPVRYPSFFMKFGRLYKIVLEKYAK